MSESRFTRPGHVAVARVLDALDTEFLTKARCYFGGGTRGLDTSVLCRDAIDLAFMIEAWGTELAAAGLALASGLRQRCIA